MTQSRIVPSVLRVEIAELRNLTEGVFVDGMRQGQPAMVYMRQLVI